MTIELRKFQLELKQGLYDSWNVGNQNTIGVLPTGGGKTVVFSSIVRDHMGYTAVVAHRKELVEQISLALGREQIQHAIIAPRATVKDICRSHSIELGRVYCDPNSTVKVIGVNTLLSRANELRDWCNQVSLWVIDECHHVIQNNVWGKGVAMFPNARGLGVTATPSRADGKGLGRHAHGVFDDIVTGPSMRQLINDGFLTDYRIFAPPSDLNLDNVEIGADGDFKKGQLSKAVEESHLVGDIVDHYLRIAPGKLGITFCTDVETAKNVCQQYNVKGVAAEVVDAKTPARIRSEILRRFKNREISQLVNVDLFGEGFDLPAVEVVSFGRPTQSYGLYVQQFGRGLRILPGKETAIIIDHAGNVVRHGLPDRERIWSLDARESKPRLKNPDDDIPLRYCVECTQPYERVRVVCPYCGTKWEPAERSSPEHVDGDLFELSPEALSKLRGEIAIVDKTPAELESAMRYKGLPAYVIKAGTRNHMQKQECQLVLRDLIAAWAGVHHARGMSDSEIQRLFYFTFKIDVMSAQALGRKDAHELSVRVFNNTRRW